MTNSIDAVNLLRSPTTIRERSQQLFKRAQDGDSPNFTLALDKLPEACDFVLAIAKKDFPSLEIPFHSRWRHFSVGGNDRLKKLTSSKDFPTDSKEQGRIFYELTIISVLLDAGAGPDWSYQESPEAPKFSRSEGLAVASFDLFKNGLFSSTDKLTADVEGLSKVTANVIAEGMQASDSNPLIGLAGRANLIKSLADAIKSEPRFFGGTSRLGRFYDYVIGQTQIEDDVIDASKVLDCVLSCFSSIWPGRISIDNQNLGDVWQHSAITGPGETNGLIPFHKLSQWLTYSLLEPLMWNGFRLANLDKMTGLAEYRNGGFFVDAGVITVKDPAIFASPHSPDSELIIEWRALTICLLDEIWKLSLKQLGKSQSDFPLVKLLEAGTWKAGRVYANKLRPDGSPPIKIKSDGTVF